MTISTPWVARASDGQATISENIFKRRRLMGAAACLAAATLGVPVRAQRAPAPVQPLSVGGSTLVQPLAREWCAKALGRDNYASVGSGEGIENLQSGSLDVALSEYPLPAVTLRSRNLVQVPLLADAVAVGYNLPGANGLQLSADVIGDMYLGSTREWSQSQVNSLNPDLKLAAAAVMPVGRADASGSSLTFLTFLARGNRSVAKVIGAELVGRFPGHVRTVRGSSAMAAELKNTRGSLGYLSLAQARQNSLQIASLRTLGTTAVTASAATVSATLNACDWDDASGAADIERTRAAGAWPLTVVVYGLYSTRAANTQPARDFLRYATTTGMADVGKFGFVELPARARAIAANRLAA